ncbi:MAG: 5'-3' exonuclease [Myxococcaceae bacterium]
MRVHLIDGTYELFRAYFSKRPSHRAPDGRDLKATVGLASSLLSLLQSTDEKVTHVAAAFDNPIRSFRNDLFDGYKTEEGVAEALLSQFEDAEDAVAALGITVWRMVDHEADDGLATGAARYAPDVAQVRILSPDKDLAQCVRGDHVVTVDRHREKVYDEAAVVEKFGVKPALIPDLLALVGDSADGIPGLPGIGEKTAAVLLARYGHLEQIPERNWDVAVRGADKLQACLKERREDVLLYRKLATLVTDAPIKESLADLEWKGVPRDRFDDWCDRVGSTRMKERPTRYV